MDIKDIIAGDSVITGKISGRYNSETKKWEIKFGDSANGNRWQSFEIAVSSKKDDKWINGKGVKVMYIGNTRVHHDEYVGLIGKFKPDNYIDKDGKEVRGNMFITSEIFKPKEREKIVPKEADVW